MIDAISPIDGRYISKCSELQTYFSEFALIKYRLVMEVKYLLALHHISLPGFQRFDDHQIKILDSIIACFDNEEARKVKEIERVTNHDVKAVEYYLSDRLNDHGMGAWSSFVHFALTSQDINNTAVPLMVKDAMGAVILPYLDEVLNKISSLASKWHGIPMLSRTHGQAASPTNVGKEFRVFEERLREQIQSFSATPIKAKFGGATGNFNAHVVAYPKVDWRHFADNFLQQLGLARLQTTTQIEHYDFLAALFHACIRVNSILIDMCQDIWTYISKDYFNQKVVEGEVGSSTMPHKVNPIDFENAEGNLGLANSIFSHLALKLPVSRLQRDLTDSTVSRNIGVPFAHSLIAWKSIIKGLEKLELNEHNLKTDLNNNWAVVTEGIQTILRREHYPNAYEALKKLSRGKSHIHKSDIHEFIQSLEVHEKVKEEMMRITPENYTGYH